jgi:hypothetical protein
MIGMLSWKKWERVWRFKRKPLESKVSQSFIGCLKKSFFKQFSAY